ncbi:13417_t:CDS:2, partial [Acaulospora colombiana]
MSLDDSWMLRNDHTVSSSGPSPTQLHLEDKPGAVMPSDYHAFAKRLDLAQLSKHLAIFGPIEIWEEVVRLNSGDCGPPLDVLRPLSPITISVNNRRYRCRCMVFDDELQNRLRTLSTSIERFYQQIEGGLAHQGRLVKDMKLEYNEIMDQHYRDDSLVYPDPLEALPPEIGLMILHKALLGLEMANLHLRCTLVMDHNQHGLQQSRPLPPYGNSPPTLPEFPAYT